MGHLGIPAILLLLAGLSAHADGHRGTLRRAARHANTINTVVHHAGDAPQTCPTPPEEPLLPAVPGCGTGNSIQPVADSSCATQGMSATSYRQMNFLARQAALSIANSANFLTYTLTCLFGTQISQAQIVDAAAHISQSFCSADSNRQAYVDCSPVPGAAASWNGGAGEGPGFHGTLNFREEKFRRGQSNGNALASMVTVIHETLHAMIEYMRSRHHLTTDPDPRTVSVPGPSGGAPVEHSNRCLNRLADRTRLSCDVNSPTGHVQRDDVTEMVTQMSMYPMGGNCEGRPANDFDSTCRASGFFREEAAVRAMAESIARSCASSIPMFFEYGNFRTQ